jgi:hypothetical protein
MRINQVTYVVQLTKSRKRQVVNAHKIKLLRRATKSAEADGSPNNPATIQVL